jgi:hypothetical protein
VDPSDLTRRKYAERYEPAWQMYIAEENPEAKADLVIDNRAVDSPLILKGA